jgi:hypothetical protein
MSTSTPWGRVTEDGTVYVRTAAGERVVGSWQAGTPEEGLAHFVRRYEDLATEVTLLETRLESGAADAKSTLARVEQLRQSVPEANVVGDLDGLMKRLDELVVAATAKREEQRKEQMLRAGIALDKKMALAEEAQKIAASSTDWKAAGDRLREIAEEWREIKGVDRKNDSELWKRFATARAEFSRRRGAYFAGLDDQRKEVQARKEQLISDAEALAESTEWDATTQRYKSLMDKWKAAGRASRDVEEELWRRFREPQDRFFARRKEAWAEQDAVLKENEEKKKALLVEAEALDPKADFEGTQAKLRDIEERWSAIGKVPRESKLALERRMREVNAKVRAVADERWRRTDVSTSPMVVRLRESVEKLERKLDRAREAGQAGEVKQLEDQLATQRQWLAQAETSEG